ncbi:MAG: Rieske 2Fe-2S domain-containing protein [Acidimicrobiales bacterium]
MDDESPQPAGSGTETWIAGAFVVALLSAIGFIVVAWQGGQPQWAGVCVGITAGAMAAGLGMWARWFMLPGGQVQHRHGLRSDDEDRAEFVEDFTHGERSMGRRGLLGGLLGAGVFASLLGALLPLRSLGPNPDGALKHTSWRRGKRLLKDDGQPIRPADIDNGSALTVFPEGAIGSADSQTLLIRYGNVPFHPRSGREAWNVDGCVAYSKVCTHAGCPVGLYEAQSHRLLCPCHQSMFDVTDGAKPVFGPATRSLPQLPLRVDEEGYFVAGGDFSGPIGPGSWHE